MKIILILFGLINWISQVEAYKYVISTYTGNKFGAGTDAKVYITLYGEKGNSGEVDLENTGENDFERNHVDVFKIDTSDVGHLSKITVRHDNTWPGAGWFLEKVRIKSEDDAVYEFLCNKWIATNEGDGQLSVDLPVTKTFSDESSDEECNKPVGISSGKITDVELTASSSYDDKHEPYHGRLNQTVEGSRGAWCSAFADDSEFLQVDLKKSLFITGIATQGQSMFDNWVTKYQLEFSNNGTAWEPYKENGTVKNFTGNYDRESIVTHWLKNRGAARYIRIKPVSWMGLTNCMRIEIYGCGLNKTSITSLAGNSSAIVIDTEAEEDPNLKPIIKEASLYFRFERPKGRRVFDISDQNNNADLYNYATISKLSDGCGNGVKLYGGDILLDGDKLKAKPRFAITIALWIKLTSTDGPRSIFDTIGGQNSNHDSGQYHFEIDDGAVRWFHRNETGQVIFNATTNTKLIPPYIWSHIACTYDSNLKKAEIYVNGKMIISVEGQGLLSQDWEGKAGIGEHKGGRILSGQIDEFYMSDKALPRESIKILMDHCTFEKECFTPLGMENMKIQDNDLTASSTYNLHKAYYGRLNLISFYDDPARSAWCAEEDDRSPFLQIDFHDKKTVTGIAVQGLSIFDNFITSFKLCYSDDGKTFTCQKDHSSDKIFEGNDDKDSVKIHWLHQFSDARYMRFYPQSWYGNHICMRAEVYGCVPGLLSDISEEEQTKESNQWHETVTYGKCSASCGVGSKMKKIECSPNNSTKVIECPNDDNGEPKSRVPCKKSPCPKCFLSYGVSNGSVEDNAMSSSSFLDDKHPAFFGRVYIQGAGKVATRGCWCAKNADKKQFLQIDLGKLRKVTGLATQGAVNEDSWVTTYRLAYSLDKRSWIPFTENYHQKVFLGNDDKETVSVRHLQHPITARYVRLLPMTWHGSFLCMRTDVYGCDNDDEPTPPLDTAPLIRQLSNMTPRNKSLSQIRVHAQHTNAPVIEVNKPITSNNRTTTILNKVHPALKHKHDDYSWGSFGHCSVTCGKGVKMRSRRCSVAECLAEGIEKEILPCYMAPCTGLSTEWSEYTPCSSTCGSGKRTRQRACDGKDCPTSGMEIEEIPCVKPQCPVLYLGFDKWEGNVILDESGMGNNAYLEYGARIGSHTTACGYFADLTSRGDVMLEDLTFRNKPEKGISVAVWVKLVNSTAGLHSLFSTAKSLVSGQIAGGYHFEIDDGKVRWFHRNHDDEPVFSVLTYEVIKPNVWQHIVGSYDSDTGAAKIFVDGELRAQTLGYGKLDTDWGYKANIGSFDYDGRYLKGLIDDFHIYNYAITKGQIRDLLSIKCPKKKRR